MSLLKRRFLFFIFCNLHALLVCLVSLFCYSLCPGESATIYYVDVDCDAPTSDGQSWSTAFPSIQQAIDVVVELEPDEDSSIDIWVAEGAYTGDDDYVVEMAEFVNLYGGFSGLESNLGDRDIKQYQTIIDGEGSRSGVKGSDQATIDGFSIINGFSSNSDDGAGMYNRYASPIVQNCTFRNNWSIGNGGAIFNEHSSAVLTNCMITNNQSYNNGGGVYCETSMVVFRDCIISNNSSTDDGGGIYIYSRPCEIYNCIITGNESEHGGGIFYDTSVGGDKELVNCLIAGNKAMSIGGGVYNEAGHLNLKYCSIINNTAGGGSGLMARYGDITVSNCIFWNYYDEIYDFHNYSVNVEYSCIKGGYSGIGNIEDDPMLWNAPEGDFRLHSQSPCRLAGSLAGAVTHDIRGAARPIDRKADIGVYQMIEIDSDHDGLYDVFEISVSRTDPHVSDSDNNGVADGEQWFNPGVFYVNSTSQVDNPDGESWETAFSSIQSAVDRAYIRGGTEVWVADGIYQEETGENVVTLYDGIKVYGGFGGTESERDQRNWDNTRTIIDGDLQRRCVYAIGNNTLDGLILRNGSAEGGAGVYSTKTDLVVDNCVFESNESDGHGGGIYVNAVQISMNNCQFVGNIATNSSSSSQGGGGAFFGGSQVDIRNSYFRLNEGSSAGSIKMYDTKLQLSDCRFDESAFFSNTQIDAYQSVFDATNCIFSYHNTNCSDVLDADSSEVNFINCTLYKTRQGLFRLKNSPLSIVNSILIGEDPMYYGFDDNTTITYSCVKGGYDGEGNTSDNPLFWNQSIGDLRIHSYSPCYDTALESDAPDLDIRHVTRPAGAGVDMGAIEMNEPDTDGDGLADEFELLYSQTDPNRFDSDLDGVGDGDEWFASGVIYVDCNNNGSVKDGYSWDTAFRDIQSAVDQAELRVPGFEIWIAEGIYTGSDSHCVVEAKEDVSFIGGFSGNETTLSQRDLSLYEATIDGESLFWGIDGDGGHLIIDGLKFKDTSGGISIYEGSSVVRNCEFDNTFGISAGRATVRVDNCHFRGGNSEGSGAISSFSYTELIVENCSFVENHGVNGGALRLDGTSAIVRNCLFLGNSAVKGGAVWDSDRTQFMNCVFSGNTALVGGAVYDEGSESIYTNCTFSMNTVWGASEDNVHWMIGEIEEEPLGGAIRCLSNLTLNNCILWDNMDGVSGHNPSRISVTNCCIEGGWSGDGNIQEKPMFWNAVNNDFRLHPSSPCLDSGVISNNVVDDIEGNARPSGSGVDLGAYEMNLPDSDHDGLHDEFEEVYSQTDSLVADTDGDGVDDGPQWLSERVYYVDSDSESPEQNGESWDTSFLSIQEGLDRAYIRGGGEVWVASGIYTGDEENIIKLRPGVSLYGGFIGEETEFAQRDLTRNKCIIDGNNASRCIMGSKNSLVDGFVVTKGFAEYGGGLLSGRTPMEVSHCEFIDNHSVFCGGGIYNEFSELLLQENSFNGNSSSQMGGAVSLHNSDLIMRGCALLANVSRSGGGVYFIDSSGDLSNCHFETNMSLSGAGAGVGSQRSELNVMGCDFLENYASGVGGGLSSSYICSLKDCYFVGNVSDGYGGGVYARYSASIDGCVFSLNYSGEFGGGLSNQNGTTSNVTNSIFALNSSGISGGAVYNNSGGEMDLVNCTLVENWAPHKGGGIYSNSATSTVRNSIIWGNVSPIWNNEGETTISYSCIEGGYPGPGNIDANPLCWNSLEGDVRLHSSSPCIDSGTLVDAPEYDYRGIPRPFGVAIDMGAYEMSDSDSDGDGLFDRFEVEYAGTSPHHSDSDSDGVGDSDEWFAYRSWKVDAGSVAETPDGTSWENAFTDIQSAVDSAYIRSGGEVWVAGGVYAGSGDNVVRLRDNVKLFGGFSGNESHPSHRLPSNVSTVIDGEYARRCVFGDTNTALDRLTLTRGYASIGGGLYNYLCSPSISNCYFHDNTGIENGGGIYFDGSKSKVINCVLFENSALKNGGGVYSMFSNLEIINCTFNKNSALNGGAIASVVQSNSVVWNSILWGNGSEIWLDDSDANVSFSCVENGYSGEGVFDSDPVFTNSPSDPLLLDKSSPCLDIGKVSGCPVVDLRGIQRPQGKGVDLGAYETIVGGMVVFSAN